MARIATEQPPHGITNPPALSASASAQTDDCAKPSPHSAVISASTEHLQRLPLVTSPPYVLGTGRNWQLIALHNGAMPLSFEL